MSNKLKKSHKKPLLISAIIFLLIGFSSFLLYGQDVDERARIVEDEKIAATQREAEAKERQAEKARIAAEKAHRQLQAKQAAEKARMQALLKVVKDFYQAINDHDCTKAIQLRPNYKCELRVKS